MWSTDLFAALAANGYAVSSRSKLNVMLRRTAQSAIGTGAGDRDAVRRDRAAIGDRLDAARLRAVERFAVAPVDVAREREAPRRADLDEIQHHRAGAGRHHVGKLVEMLGAALGHRVGKFGKARAAASGARS